MNKNQIVTITLNPSVDNFTSVKRLVPERKLRCSPPRQYPGGGGINVSRSLKALGRSSLALFTCGGSTGLRFRELFKADSIGENIVSINNMTRESMIVYDESGNQQFRLNFPGPHLRKDEWGECLQRLEDVQPSPEYVVASGTLPPGVPDDFYKHVARIAASKGAKCIIDASGRALVKAVEAGVFLIKPNVNELKEFGLNESRKTGYGIEYTASKLVKTGKCRGVVVSLGRAGAVLATKEGTERLHAPQVEVKNIVGAGDNMVAGIVFGMSGGMSIRDAVLFGIAAATSNVACQGSGLCSPGMANRLYKELKILHG